MPCSDVPPAGQRTSLTGPMRQRPRARVPRAEIFSVNENFAINLFRIFFLLFVGKLISGPNESKNAKIIDGLV